MNRSVKAYTVYSRVNPGYCWVLPSVLSNSPDYDSLVFTVTSFFPTDLNLIWTSKT